jgi:chromosome segregation ATPase
MRFAQERLDQAEMAMTERDYTLATNLAEESAVNSELAAVKARLGKLRESVDTLKQQNAEISRVLGSTGSTDGGAP